MITQFLQAIYATTEHEVASVADSLGHVADTVAHAAEGAHEGASHELPNIIGMLAKIIGESFTNIHHWENIIFAFLAAIFLCIGATTIARKRKMVPGRLQSLAELLVEGLYNFFHSMLGSNARKYTPFLGTLFIYILAMNWMGLVPFLKAPTSSATITVSLALIVFVYSQAIGLRRLGPWGWFYHLMGSPKSGVEWGLVPLNLPIHLIGELAKPVSLSMRLFGNITGEDILIAAFTGIGVLILSFFHSPVGLPIQVVFYFLGMLMSAIQALVFTSLATIYIAMMLPHEEHAEAH